MKSKNKKILVFSLLILALLTSCGGASKGAASNESFDMAVTANSKGKGGFFNGLSGSTSMGVDSFDEGYSYEIAAPQEPMSPDSEETGTTQNYDEKKVVYSASVDMEAKDIEAALKTIKTNLDTYRGYIQSENRDNWNSFDVNARMYRHANLSLRIPSQHFEAFLDGLSSEEMIIVGLNKSSTDYSEYYYDKETRINSLKVQEERLLQLLSTANNVEVMLQIENRMSDVRYEIESLTKELRTIDSKVEYSTVDIYISEVMRYSTPVTEPVSFLDEMKEAFKDSFEDFVYFLRNLSISLAHNSVGLVFIAAILFVVITFVRSRSKKKKAKKVKSNSTTLEDIPNDNKK